ncbi:hypothetical protein [Helicobacter cetorum]|nr:hypothetical protein [Helicobacter cetorum]
MNFGVHVYFETLGYNLKHYSLEIKEKIFNQQAFLLGLVSKLGLT